MPVQKVPNSWGELKNLEPAAYGTSDIPATPVPFDPGLPDPNDPKAYNWQQWLIDLKDVPRPNYPEDIGKSLIFRPLVDPNSGYSVAWEIPSQILTPRNFSITGDGEAPEVLFNGTADVVLNLTNLQADKWKTARTVTITGVDASGNFTIDGSANVNFPVTVIQAPKWTTARTLSLTGNATGSVSWDGSANASMAVNVNQATNATNAVNANTATTASTANALANGAITVTLTGGVTGSAAISGGVVTIPTTVAGSGGGSGANGQTDFGNSKQYWGRATTVASGGNAELVITFPDAFTGPNDYAITFGFPENVGAPSGDVDFNYTMNLTSRLPGSITFNILAKDSNGAISAIGWIFSYIAVGQIIP